MTELLEQTKASLVQVRALMGLEELEVNVLGRKGRLAELMKQLKDVSAEERPTLGVLANEVKTALESAFSQARQSLAKAEIDQRLGDESADVTEPGIRPPEGHLHVTTQAIREIREVFERAGFSTVRYPEIDWEIGRAHV